MRLQALSRYGKGRSKEEPAGAAKQSKRSRMAATARSGAGAAVTTLGVTVELRRQDEGAGLVALPELRLRHLRVPTTCCVVHVVQYVADQVKEADPSLAHRLGHDKASFAVEGKHVTPEMCLSDLSTCGHVVVHYAWLDSADGAAARRSRSSRK
jgi:hypothetical protein